MIQRPNDATTILVAEVILEIIATLSSSILTSLKSRTLKSEKQVLSKLETALPQTLSEALGIEEEVGDDELKTLTHIIQEEVRENVCLHSSSEKGTTKQRLIPVSRINDMVVNFTGIFKKFSHKIKTLIGPRSFKMRNETIRSPEEDFDFENTESPTAEEIKKDIKYEVKEIFSPLMMDIPEAESEQLKLEILHELDIVAKDMFTFSKRRPKSAIEKPSRKKIKSFFTKCFAKVYLTRIFAKLKKTYPEHAKVNIQSAERILEELSFQFVDQQNLQNETEDVLVQVFTDFHGNTDLFFSQELSDLIQQHVLSNNVPCSVQTEVQADVWNKSFVFLALMNWYMNTQVHWVVARVKVPGINVLPITFINDEAIACRKAEAVKNSLYVKFLIEKIVYTICSDAKFLPKTINDSINTLKEIVWEKVKDKTFYQHSKVFHNLEKDIKNLVYKVLGSPDKILFFITCKDPVVVNQIMLIIEKRLLMQRKRRGVISQFFCSLGKAICKTFKPSNNTVAIYAKDN